jgi:MraZ protein
MFFGEFFHQKDDNNRIRIPTPFKQELGGTFYFAKGLDGVINVLPVKIVEEQLAKLQSSISEFDEDEQEALLEYTSSVFEVNEDKHGRIRIPDILVEFAGLKKDIVTVGMGNKLSIMTKELREEKRSKRTHAQNMDILNKKLKG